MFKRKLRKSIASILTGATVLLTVNAFALVPTVARAAVSDLVKSADSGTVYVVLADGDSICSLVSEGHYDMWAQYKAKGVGRWQDVSTVDTSTYTDSGVCSLRVGSLVRTAANPEVFVIQSGNTKRGFDAWETFVADGYGSGGVYFVTDAALSGYTTGTKITTATTSSEIREGQLVKYASAATVYYVAKEDSALVKREVTNEDAYFSNFGINWNLVITVPDTETYTTSASQITGADTAINRPVVITVTPPAVAGDINVTLAGDTPSGALAPTKSYGNVFTKLVLSGQGTISSITVKREGLGARTDFAAVYLYVDGVKQTSARTFNSDDKALFSLGSGIALTAGTTKTLSIVGDMAAIATTGQHKLGIAAAGDIASTATISGTFPLMGNYVSTSTTTVGEMTTTAVATVADTEVYVGEQVQELARFQFVSGSAEKVRVNSIRFRNTGSANTGTDYTNFKLYKGGTVMDGVTFTVNGDYVSASNVNLTFEKSETVLIKLYGDVIGGASSTIQWGIEEASDISATGLSYNYGVTINNTSGATTWTEQKSPTTATTILAGTLTLAITGPQAASVEKKADNIVVANLSITAPASETITITRMYGYIEGTEVTASAKNLQDTVENIQLVQKTGGTQVIDATTSDGTANDNDSFYFANFDVKGATTWEVIFDTNDSEARATDKYRFVVYADDDSQTVGDNAGVTAIQAKNSAGRSLTSSTRDDIKPGTLLYGNYSTLQDVSLTFTSVSLSNGYAVAKETNIQLMKFQIVGGSAGAVKITGIQFSDGGSDTTTGSTHLTNFSLYDATGTETLLQSGVSASAADGDYTVTFSALDGGKGLTIPASGTKTLLVKTDFSASVTTQVAQVQLADANAITAEKVSDGTSVASANISGLGSVLSGRTVTGTASGLLTVSLNTQLTTATTTQILAGTTGVAMMNLKFNADYENVSLKYLKLDLVTNATKRSVGNVWLYDGATCAYKDEAGACIAGTFTEGATDSYVEFGDAQSTFITFDKDVDKTLTVKTDVRTIGGTTGTAASGDEIRWTLDAETAADTNDSVTAAGVSSNNNLTYDTTRADSKLLFGTGVTQADQSSNIFHVRRDTIANITPVALSTVGGTTVLSDGAMPIFAFKVTVAATGNQNAAVDLTDLYLTVNNSGLTGLTSANIYRTDAAATTVNASSTALTAIQFIGTGSDLSGLTNIGPGESATFVVEATIAGASAGDTLQVRIASLGAQGTEGTVDFSAGDLVWSDNDDETTDDKTSWISWPGITINSVTGETLIKPAS